MATKAYLLVQIKEEFGQNGQMEHIFAQLECIPEVRCVELVDGICDLVVQIEAPIRAVFAANKVLAMDWVKHLCLLKVEPLAVRHRKPAIPSIPKPLDPPKLRLVAEAEQHIAMAAKVRPVGRKVIATKE